MRACDAKSVHQPDRVLGHIIEIVGRGDQLAGERAQEGGLDVDLRRVLDFRRQPYVAIVEADDAKAAVGQPAAKGVRPGDHLRGEAHDKE